MSKGQRYFTPAWMQLPVDPPISQARQASLELTQAQWDEQQQLDAARDEIEGNKEDSPPLPSKTDPAEQATESDGRESWLETIANLMASGSMEGLIVNAINTAIAEVDEQQKEQIVRLARDSLSVDALNRIELAF